MGLHVAVRVEAAPFVELEAGVGAQVRVGAEHVLVDAGEELAGPLRRPLLRPAAGLEAVAGGQRLELAGVLAVRGLCLPRVAAYAAGAEVELLIHAGVGGCVGGAPLPLHDGARVAPGRGQAVGPASVAVHGAGAVAEPVAGVVEAVPGPVAEGAAQPDDVAAADALPDLVDEPAVVVDVAPSDGVGVEAPHAVLDHPAVGGELHPLRALRGAAEVAVDAAEHVEGGAAGDGAPVEDLDAGPVQQPHPAGAGGRRVEGPGVERAGGGQREAVVGEAPGAADGVDDELPGRGGGVAQHVERLFQECAGGVIAAELAGVQAQLVGDPVAGAVRGDLPAVDAHPGQALDVPGAAGGGVDHDPVGLPGEVVHRRSGFEVCAGAVEPLERVACGGVRDLGPAAVRGDDVAGVGHLDRAAGAVRVGDVEPVAEHPAARVRQRPSGRGQGTGAVEALERVVGGGVRDLEPATVVRRDREPGVGHLDPAAGTVRIRHEEPVAEHPAARVGQRPPGRGQGTGAVERWNAWWAAVSVIWNPAPCPATV